MEDLRFKSLNELYLRVYPALETKNHELKRLGIISITENDIWNYLKNNKWFSAENLTLNEIVDDILNIDINDLEKAFTNNN